MINKKNLLGTVPFELGDKDAIHVAIVSVRAGAPIHPGSRCAINGDGEAVVDPGSKGPGIADPFRKETIAKGDSFWLLLNQDAVPNVRHVWEHPEHTFAPPTKAVEKNRYIEKYAAQLGVTYAELMETCSNVVRGGRGSPYPRPITPENLESLLENVDSHDLWYEWSNETGFEFANDGSECCPEYSYPDTALFIAYH